MGISWRGLLRDYQGRRNSEGVSFWTTYNGSQGNTTIFNYENDVNESSFVQHVDRMYKASATTLQRAGTLVSM